mmetsp:Transcript_17255/g.41560  ORF Transcript_17255/g.41560 Transcript_17255/m.41560 type:complete len:205 (+) Transcript_17255:96-710(+)
MGKALEQQLNLADCQLCPKALGHFVDHLEVDAHVAIAPGLGCVEVWAHPILQALHSHVVVGDDEPQTVCEIRHVLKDEAVARDVQQQRRIILVAPKQLLERSGVTLHPRPLHTLHQLGIILDIAPSRIFLLPPCHGTIRAHSHHPRTPVCPRLDPLVQQQGCNSTLCVELIHARHLGLGVWAPGNVPVSHVPKQRIQVPPRNLA